MMNDDFNDELGMMNAECATKDNSALNVPAIRFEGFSGEWEQRKLETIFNKIRNAFVGTATPYYVKSGNFYLESNNVKNGKINRSTEVFINDEFYQKQSDKWLRAGDIVMVQSGHVGHTAVIPPELNNIAAHALIMFTDTKEEVNPHFLNFQFQTIKSKNKLSEITTGNTIKHILSSEMKEFHVSLPHFKEQDIVGNYFQQLDTLIAQHQQKHDKLLNLKKALLGLMFPKQGATVPEIRFKGFSGEWEEKKLDCEVDLYSGLTYSPSDVTKEPGTFVLRSSNVKGGEIVDADNVYVNTEVVNSENVRVGDIIIVVRNGSRSLIGKHAVIKQEMNNTVIGAFMTGMHAEQSDFINALLDTNQFNKEIEKNLGATINQITNGAFREMQFYFPKPKEQTKIGNLFKQLDTLKTQHQAQLKKLNNIKQACLEKMFV